MKKKADRAIKIHPEYHLIVTEGTDTEPAYQEHPWILVYQRFHHNCGQVLLFFPFVLNEH